MALAADVCTLVNVAADEPVYAYAVRMASKKVSFIRIPIRIYELAFPLLQAAGDGTFLEGIVWPLELALPMRLAALQFALVSRTVRPLDQPFALKLAMEEFTSTHLAACELHYALAIWHVGAKHSLVS